MKQAFNWRRTHCFLRFLTGCILALLVSNATYGQLAGYSYQQDITIDHTKVSGTSDLTDFPLLVHVTEDYLRSTSNGGEVTSSNGYDIAFSVDGTNQLDHEIETYNPATGDYVAWVRIPTLYSSQYTILYMSFGNASVTVNPSTSSTWNSDYQGVWHLDENTTDEASGAPHLDATSNNYIGWQNGNAVSTGKFGSGQDFDGVNNSTGDYINVGTGAGSTQDLTVSFWMNTDVDNTYQRALGKLASDHASDQGWSFMLRPAGEAGFNRGMIFRIGDGTDYGGWTNEISAENVYTAGTWVHITGTFSYNGSNGGTGTLFANGVQLAQRSNTDGRGVANTDTPLYFGWDVWGGAPWYLEQFDGTLDEVRLSSVARSADWIATEFNNQSDPSSFYTVGSKPDGPGGVGTTDGTSSLTLWLDASQIAGLDNGENLTGWTDLSGYGNNAAIGTAPSYAASWGGNGQPAVHFDDNNNEYLSVSANTDVKPTSALSVFIAGNYDSSSDEFGSLINTASGDAWDDGWGIGSELGGSLALYYFTDWTGAGGTEWCGINASVDNQDHIYGLVHAAGTSTAYEDEGTCTFGSDVITYTNPSDPLLIGAGPNDTGAGYFMTGEIGEVIFHKTNLNNAQRIIVNNYLSSKYGIPLTTHDAYNEDDLGFYHDVAGIGRYSGGGNTHTDAQGTGIIRILNPSDLNNYEFMMWGHDNGPMSIDDGDVPSGVVAKLERTWAVSEMRVLTGAAQDVGTVQVRFDLSNMGAINASDLRLVVDTDGDGVFADDATVVSGATLVSGHVYEFAGVTQLVDNSRFTIGTADYSTTPLEVSPGNVPLDMTLWLRGDAGLTNNGVAVTSGSVDTWANSTDNSDFTEVTLGTGAPVLQADGINYSPAVYFDGVDDKFQKNNVAGSALFSDQDNTMIAVFQRSTPNGTDVYGGWRSTGDTRRMAYIEGRSDGTLRTDVWSQNFSGTEDHTAKNVIMIVQTSAGGSRMIVNGLEESTFSPTMDAITGLNGDFAVGCNGGTSAYVQTYFSEYIIHKSALSDAEISRIQSSLAMKYGITLNGSDYFASDGTKIWDATADPDYQNEIVAIGRDDNTALYLKQSRYQDDSLIVYMDALAADNVSNAGSISNNLSFIVIGHNGERLAAVKNLETPSGIYSRFDREWKVTNYNFSDSYSIEIEWEELGAFDINDIRLLVDDDGDFSNATVLGPSNGLTFSVGSIIVGGITTAHIPANQTSYITLGSISAGTPLPVELLSFEASANEADNSVEIRWSTASEVDNELFSIERSSDLEEWKTILQIPGAGNSVDQIAYEATDEDPLPGLSYYRLKQTDYDGQMGYSEIRQVVIGDFGETMRVFPNPANREIYIQGHPEDLANLKILDVLGREVTKNIKVLNRSMTALRLDVSQLPVGVYMIRTRNGDQRFLKH